MIFCQRESNISYIMAVERSKSKFYTWDGFQRLDDGITIAGCDHAFRTIKIGKTDGVKLFGLLRIGRQTVYKTNCNLKEGKPCGYPCPIGKNRSMLNAIHKEAASLS